VVVAHRSSSSLFGESVLPAEFTALHTFEMVIRKQSQLMHNVIVYLLIFFAIM
jgi:hypothetical protein